MDGKEKDSLYFGLRIEVFLIFPSVDKRILKDDLEDENRQSFLPDIRTQVEKAVNWNKQEIINS